MDDIEDTNTSGSGPAPATTVTIKAVYCPGSNQEEIRRFNFQLPAACSDDGGGSEGDAKLFDEFRRRISAACSAAGDSLSLYYMDADQERVRFSTGEELRQLLRQRGQAAAPLRILAEPSAAGGDADGVDHPGVLCDGCNQGIRGRRFRCFLCPDYDLCQQCVLRGVHDQHSMLVLHRPGDADSLPPWLCRGGLGRGGGGGGRWGGPGSWMWPGAVGRHFPWQQQQQQQMPGAPPPFTRPTMPHMPPHGPHHPHHVPHMQMPPPPPPPMPPLSVACPKLARKVEKARCRFEAKLAKRCDRVQRRWVRRQQKQCQKLHQRQQQQQQDPAAPGTADQPIRIDGDDQQQQQQQFSPEEALLLKQLRKRHKQSAAAAAAGKKQKPKKSHHHRHHHKKSSRGGRKRRRSGSSSSSSSCSSTSSSASSSSSGSSSDSEGESDAETAQEKAYRQLLKKFKKMGFKDDDTCWLRELIREKRGNLNDIIDAIQQRKQQQQQGACGGRDV